MHKVYFGNGLYSNNNTLKHHGVLGMKWGVRRYQNTDGSYKSSAEGRYAPDSSNSNNSSKRSINDQVKRARETGKYDMEFLEKELDVDQRTGDLLEGKDLDKAYAKYLKGKTNSKTSKPKSDKERENAIKERVALARKTGKYDMEFLEKELDVDQRTGDLLEGKDLDKAYAEYLRKK